MSSTTHSTANYLKIFYILLALTIVEVALVYLHLPKLLLVGLLIDSCGLESRAGGDALHASQIRKEDPIDRCNHTVCPVRFSDSHVAAGYFPPVIPLSQLPALNAALNSLSAVFLFAGFFFIKSGNRDAHQNCMLAAFTSSILFLISYLTYHYQVGSVGFKGQGWIRTVYFTILISHTILAVTVVPLALVTLSRALKGKFAHIGDRALDFSHLAVRFGDRHVVELVADPERQQAGQADDRGQGREGQTERPSWTAREDDTTAEGLFDHEAGNRRDRDRDGDEGHSERPARAGSGRSQCRSRRPRGPERPRPSRRARQSRARRPAGPAVASATGRVSRRFGQGSGAAVAPV